MRAYGQRTRCAPCHSRGCGADIDRAARREQRYEATRAAALAAFAKSWLREASLAGLKPGEERAIKSRHRSAKRLL
jgi:hypothetical protein